jgi:hypothetical protein
MLRWMNQTHIKETDHAKDNGLDRVVGSGNPLHGGRCRGRQLGAGRRTARRHRGARLAGRSGSPDGRRHRPFLAEATRSIDRATRQVLGPEFPGTVCRIVGGQSPATGPYPRGAGRTAGVRRFGIGRDDGPTGAGRDRDRIQGLRGALAVDPQPSRRRVVAGSRRTKRSDGDRLARRGPDARDDRRTDARRCRRIAVRSAIGRERLPCAGARADQPRAEASQRPRGPDQSRVSCIAPRSNWAVI